jgi:uncharacterized protein GlcG (DUF336 family)
MSKRTWALISAFQTVLVVLAIVLFATRPGAAAPDASPAAQADAARVAEQAAPPPGFLPTITRQEARVIIDGAVEKAIELRGTMVAAVLDAGGNLVSLDRMDGRGPTTDKLAIGKAMGSLNTRRPTREFPDLLHERPDRYFGVLSTLAGQVYMVNGGQPLVQGGYIIGAVGVAGLGPGEDDMAIDAGVARWQSMRQSTGR